MNDPYMVSFHAAQRIIRFVLDKEKFESAEHLTRKQRKAWAYLQRTKGIRPTYTESVEVVRHLVEPQRVVDYILAQVGHLIDDYDREATRVLLGAKQYAELMRTPRFTTDSFYIKGVYNNSKKVLGLDITVVPWMSGVIVMP